METSSPGSMISAAAMLSSRARLAGFLPCACESTTVSLRRPRRCSAPPRTELGDAGWLMRDSIFLGVDLALDQTLGVLPVVGQEPVVGAHVEQRRGVFAPDVVQPAGPVAIDVDRRGVLE